MKAEIDLPGSPELAMEHPTAAAGLRCLSLLVLTSMLPAVAVGCRHDGRADQRSDASTDAREMASRLPADVGAAALDSSEVEPERAEKQEEGEVDTGNPLAPFAGRSRCEEGKTEYCSFEGIDQETFSKACRALKREDFERAEGGHELPPELSRLRPHPNVKLCVGEERPDHAWLTFAFGRPPGPYRGFAVPVERLLLEPSVQISPAHVLLVGHGDFPAGDLGRGYPTLFSLTTLKPIDLPMELDLRRLAEGKGIGVWWGKFPERTMPYMREFARGNWATPVVVRLSPTTVGPPQATGRTDIDCWSAECGLPEPTPEERARLDKVAARAHDEVDRGDYSAAAARYKALEERSSALDSPAVVGAAVTLRLLYEHRAELARAAAGGIPEKRAEFIIELAEEREGERNPLTHARAEALALLRASSATRALMAEVAPLRLIIETRLDSDPAHVLPREVDAFRDAFKKGLRLAGIDLVDTGALSKVKVLLVIAEHEAGRCLRIHAESSTIQVGPNESPMPASFCGRGTEMIDGVSKDQCEGSSLDQARRLGDRLASYLIIHLALRAAGAPKIWFD